MNTNIIKKPYGLRVMRAYCILNIIFLIIPLFYILTQTNLSLIINPIVIKSLLIVFISTFVIFAINNPRKSFYKILIWLFTIEIAISLGSSTAFSIKNFIDDILVIMPLFFCIWYLTQLKNYFIESGFNKEDPITKQTDKKVNPFIIMWVVLVIISSVINAWINVNNKVNLEKGNGNVPTEKLI